MSVDLEAERSAVQMTYDKDLSVLVPVESYRAAKRRRDLPAHEFLKGPIPLRWITAAFQLPGQAAHVGMAIWFVHGLRQQAPFALKADTLRRFGVTRRGTLYRALDVLQGAGLIRVHRSGRQSLRVSIVLAGPEPTEPTTPD